MARDERAQHVRRKCRERLAVSLVAAMALGGCWSDDDDESTSATTEVPDSAAASSASFIDYLLALDPADESDEPSIIQGKLRGTTG